MIKERQARFAALALVGVVASACATRGQIREAISGARAEIALERDSAIAVETEARRTQVAEVETRLSSRIDSVANALHSDIESLRTEYGMRVTAMEDTVKFLMPVQFDFDDATVRDQDRPLLERFAKIMDHYYPGARITIEGFADPRGTTSYNLALSQRRAEAVRDALMENGLVNAQLNVVGYGETRLVVPGAGKSDPGAEMNRRVVFAVETVGAPAAVTTALREYREQ
jgi:peptidoglycan-associated lipoprotein